MKRITLILAITSLMVACGGVEDQTAEAAKAAEKARPKTCENGLSLAGETCVAQQKPSSSALETQ